jgi:Domain of unknown function (DUF1996)
MPKHKRPLRPFPLPLFSSPLLSPPPASPTGLFFPEYPPLFQTHIHFCETSVQIPRTTSIEKYPFKMKFHSDTSKLIKVGMVAVGMGFLQSAHAFFRMPCSQPVVVERADPIVNPGAVSGHLHTIMGSSGFNFTEDVGAAQAGQCTSCKVRGITLSIDGIY